MTDVKQKPLTLKNIKEALVMYTGEQATFDEVWSAFCEMACLGFISQDLWSKLYTQCGGWFIDEAADCVRDMRQGGKVVWKYEKGKQYRA